MILSFQVPGSVLKHSLHGQVHVNVCAHTSVLAVPDTVSEVPVKRLENCVQSCETIY